MAYITTTQLQTRLGSSLYARLTDRVNGAVADVNVAQDIVDGAEALADSYLGQRHDTPIDLTKHSELADLLETRVLDLAEYLAWRDSPFATDIPERIRMLHEEALGWFGSVAAGALELPASSALSPAPTRGAASNYQATARQFTHDELDGL